MANFKEINKSTLRRVNKLYIGTVSSTGKTDEKALGAFVANLYSLGYTLTIDAMKTLSAQHSAMLKDILDVLQEVKGDHVKHEIMYPNFPQQVLDADETELWLNAILHYAGNAVDLRIMPNYAQQYRGQESVETKKLIVLDVATNEDVETLAKNIFTSSRPWSDVDKKDLDTLSDYLDDTIEISVKENIATAITLFPQYDFSSSVKTVLDVLRIATAMSDGDTSLATNTKFKLSRKQRRHILSLFNSIVSKDGEESVLTDAALHQEKLKKLAHQLHHNEYKSRYTDASSFLDSVQKNEGKSLYAHIENAMQNGSVSDIVNTLQKYPSVFARRLHETIVKHAVTENNREKIVYGFKAVAHKVSPAVLVQAWQFFASSDSTDLDEKLITLKTGKSVLINNSKKNENWDDVLDALEYGMKRNNNTSRWKNTVVHIVNENNELDDNYVVPVSVRGISESDRVIGRGSSIALHDNADTVRLFMHWKDIDSSSPDRDWYGRYRNTVDLDISATLVSEDFAQQDNVWYGSLRSGVHAVHSGDITSAPNGASEYIDIRIDDALKAGYRYVLPSILSYSQQPFSDIPEAFAGVMLRNGYGTRGEAFDASKVETKFDLTKESRKSIPYAFDLKTRSLIWIDASIGSGATANAANNVHTNQTMLQSTLKTVVHTDYMKAYDYISHVVGVNNIVTDETVAQNLVDNGSDVVKVHLDRAEDILQFLQ